jgi:hypothetical protein
MLLTIITASVSIAYVYAEEQVTIPIATVDFVGSTYNDPQSFSVSVSDIKNAKEIFIEVNVKSTDDNWFRYITIEIDGQVVNPAQKGARYYTAVISPYGDNPLRYDVTSLVTGKDVVDVTIRVWTLRNPYDKSPTTWSVTAQFIGILEDSIVLPPPTGGEAVMIPVYMASGVAGLGFLGLAYYFRRRED